MKRARRGSNWIPACTGEEGLLRLLKKAHDLYFQEVTARRKSYRRFVLDFLHSTRYHDDEDAWSRNEHQKNYSIVAALLLNHEKMVRRFFDCGSIDDERLAGLLSEFYRSDLPRHADCGGIDGETPERESAEPNTGPGFQPDKETFNLIVRLANEVNLSKEVLDAEEMMRAYDRHEMTPIVSANNVRLALVLDRLSSHNVIPYNWESLIERRRLVLSSSGKKFLGRHDLAATLNRIKDAPLSPENAAVLSIVDSYVALIKNSKIK